MEATAEKVEIKKYPAYKDSGENWIAEIPGHWEVKKLKLIFKEKKIRHNPELNCGSISFGKVVIKDDEKIPLSTKASYQEVLKGEFLINPLNLNYDLISLRIALSEIDVVVSSGYIVLNNVIEINKGYFKYLLHRYDVAYMKLLGSGVRQTINFNHIANSLLISPPLPEQTAIAQFLDRKTTQIDQAIGIKEKQIELLKEHRQVLIHQAVTRGLNPDVPLRDSKIEFLGGIPITWDTIKLKYIVRTKARLGWKGLKASEYVDKSNYGFLSTPNIKGEEIDFNNAYFITQQRYDESPEIMLQKDDVLLVKDGSTLGIVNIINELPFHCTVNSSIAVLRITQPEKLNATYLQYFLKSDYSQKVIDLKKDGMGVPHLFQSDINNFIVLIPSLEEQNEIVEYVMALTSKLASAILCKQKEIVKMKQYKTSLINSAVTGKIKII